MVVAQGDIYWADLPAPSGSEAGFRRPVVVVQSDKFNQSRLKTVVCIPLTGNLGAPSAPGNVLLDARSTGLPRDSVARITQILSFDKTLLVERIGRVSPRQLGLLFSGIDVVLGR